MIGDNFLDINDDFLILVDRYLTGNLDPDESARLMAMLSADPDKANVLCDNVLVDFWFHKKTQIRDDEQAIPGYLVGPLQHEDELRELVRWEREAIPHRRLLKPQPGMRNTDSITNHLSTGRSKNPFSILSTWRLAPLAVAVALFLILICMADYHFLRPGPKEESSAFVPFAKVVETINVEWLDPESSCKKGQNIGRGELAFSRGLLQLAFLDGTELILEGPAQFVIAGEKNTFCNQGKISAHVPKEGVGFQITTPLGTVVDRGTDFALEVSGKKTRVDVVTGEVDLFTTSTSSRLSLPQGKGAAIDITNKVRPFDSEQDRFITPSHFRARKSEHSQQVLDQFRTQSETWNAHPHLLARFDLSGMSGPRTENRSVKGKKLLATATMDNCRLTKGFYEGTAALLFGEKGSFDFDLPGAFRNLTLVACVRIDDLKNRANVLLASHDFYTAPGTLVWQILPDGAIQVQLTPSDKSHQSCFSSLPFTWPNHWQTWSTVAVVLNADKKTISYFYDGRLVAELPWKNPVPLYVGKASLGSMQRTRFELSPLQLNGAIDDFQIFDKALSSAEISQMRKLY